MAVVIPLLLLVFRLESYRSKRIARRIARLRGVVPRMPSCSGSNPSTLICANMEGIHTRSPWSSTVARGSSLLLRLEGMGNLWPLPSALRMLCR